jgi:NAD(P)-dependent dehydrogenase (short-subunit alcohol dehydrogenase family)
VRLADKVALVTGGTQGIGRAIADRFAQEGARVTIIDLRESDTPWGEGQRFKRGDVVEPQMWEDTVAEVLEADGKIDILVSNAGIIDQARLHEMELAEWDRVVAVNQTAVMLGMRTVIPRMIDAGGGSIVNISSIWGSLASGGAASYHATKAAVRNLTKNAAVTYAPDGVRANTIHPGIINTPIVQLQAEEKTAWVVAQTPLGRVGEPEEIANGALFLASDEAAYITGTELYIDGGFTAQ